MLSSTEINEISMSAPFTLAEVERFARYSDLFRPLELLALEEGEASCLPDRLSVELLILAAVEHGEGPEETMESLGFDWHLTPTLHRDSLALA
jgi:hypothetical protein